MGLSQGGREQGLDADVIAIAVNQKTDSALIHSLSMKAEEFYIVGDCKKPARIKEAVEAGEEVARSI